MQMVFKPYEEISSVNTQVPNNRKKGVLSYSLWRVIFRVPGNLSEKMAEIWGVYCIVLEPNE